MKKEQMRKMVELGDGRQRKTTTTVTTTTK